MEYPENAPIFAISTAAQLLNISVHTLRLYEREGLIIPSKNESGQRLYSMDDIKRVEEIRKTINVHKISIAGIKTLLAMLPCWYLETCKENAKTCKAFNEHSKPCWTLKHTRNFCAKKDCKKCAVYNNYIDFRSVKSTITQLFLNQ